MEIKRIQLRGISRTPSDRTTADGGVAESLNVYLDTDETAPVLKPEDISSDIGLVEDRQFDRVFIHKTLNKENYICMGYTDDSFYEIGFYYKSSFKRIAVLDRGESVVGVAPIGNTLVLSTEKRTLYLLFKGDEYIFLGDSIPRVAVGFANIDQRPLISDVSEEEDTTLVGQSIWKNKTGEVSTKDSAPLGDEANEYRVLDESSTTLLSHIWEMYQEMIGHNLNMGCFNAPVMLRYAVKLYDDTYLQASSPILLGGAFNDGEVTKEPLQIFHQSKSVGSDTIAYEHKYKISLCYPFKIGMYKEISDVNYEDWKDIIKSVDVFITPPINLFPDGKTSARYSDYATDSGGYTRKIILDPVNSEDQENIEKNIISNGSFFKVESFTLEDMIASSISNLVVLSGDMRGENISTKEMFKDVNVSGEVVTDKMASYNNSVLSYGGKLLLPHGLSSLNGQHAYYDAPSEYFSYAFRYHVEDAEGTDLIVYSRNLSGGIVLNPNKGTALKLSSGRFTSKSVSCVPFAFISYPDSRCYAVDICKYSYDGSEVGVCTLQMNPHPTVPNCSYAWLGLGESLHSLNYTYLGRDFETEIEENRTEIISNKLLMSSPNNPFSFPYVNRISFQANVLGVAVATTALSQGQFGQFPLYVFTEDGIWVMETASDGSFISSKPLSREVCSNPDSITPIDQAVVFVSDKGLMLLQGSQITELSPFMNGKHYVINDSAKQIIKGQPGYDGMIETLSDPSSFMAFMKHATIGYDYQGKRLICINETQDHQYVYKLDTQTWHRTLHAGMGRMIAPLNSYPRCEVMAQTANGTRIIDLSTSLDGTKTQRPEKGVIATRPFDLDAPDILKTIKDVRIRGQFAKGAVKFILQGSQDNINWYTISTLRGKSWKMFRLILLTDLDIHERISWVDVQYETRFTNKLR